MAAVLFKWTQHMAEQVIYLISTLLAGERSNVNPCPARPN